MGWDGENVTSVQQGTSFATPSNYSSNVLLLLYLCTLEEMSKNFD